MEKTKVPDPGGSELEAWLAACRHASRSELDALRAIVRAAAPELLESLKWNAPSYQIPGGDHCLTFNLGPTALRLIFHRGAKKKDRPGGKRLVAAEHAWLEWPTNDRAVATFSTMAEVMAAKAALTRLVTAWVAAVAGE